MPNVAYIIHKHSHDLYFSERCKNDFENLPIVAYNHPNNSSDTFVIGQLPETNDCNNDRATPGSFRCSSNCTTCPYCWFSVSHPSKSIKMKIRTVQQFKSRIWEMKGGKYTKILAKIRVRENVPQHKSKEPF